MLSPRWLYKLKKWKQTKTRWKSLGSKTPRKQREAHKVEVSLLHISNCYGTFTGHSHTNSYLAPIYCGINGDWFWKRVFPRGAQGHAPHQQMCWRFLFLKPPFEGIWVILKNLTDFHKTVDPRLLKFTLIYATECKISNKMIKAQATWDTCEPLCLHSPLLNSL